MFLFPASTLTHLAGKFTQWSVFYLSIFSWHCSKNPGLAIPLLNNKPCRLFHTFIAWLLPIVLECICIVPFSKHLVSKPLLKAEHKAYSRCLHSLKGARQAFSWQMRIIHQIYSIWGLYVCMYSLLSVLANTKIPGRLRGSAKFLPVLNEYLWRWILSVLHKAYNAQGYILQLNG